MYLKKQGVNLDLENILLNDKKTFALLKNGRYYRGFST